MLTSTYRGQENLAQAIGEDRQKTEELLRRTFVSLIPLEEIIRLIGCREPF